MIVRSEDLEAALQERQPGQDLHVPSVERTFDLADFVENRAKNREWEAFQRFIG